LKRIHAVTDTELSVIDFCIYSSTLHFVQVKYRIKSAPFLAALLGVPSSARLPYLPETLYGDDKTFRRIATPP